MDSIGNQTATTEKTPYTTLVAITALCALSTAMGTLLGALWLASAATPAPSMISITAAPALSLYVTIRFWKRAMAAKARQDGVIK